jgi:hypothetical protein
MSRKVAAISTMETGFTRLSRAGSGNLDSGLSGVSA